jgi:hypothetical protein
MDMDVKGMTRDEDYALPSISAYPCSSVGNPVFIRVKPCGAAAAWASQEETRMDTDKEEDGHG